jgi:hypothetical protein
VTDRDAFRVTNPFGAPNPRASSPPLIRIGPSVVSDLEVGSVTRAKANEPAGAEGHRISGVHERSHGQADPAAPMLAGQAVLDSRWAFEQVIGRDVVARSLASLPEDVRLEYERATPLTWISYATMRAVHDAYARETKEPIERLLDRVLPIAIERSFKTVWRLLLRFTNDEALIARTPLLYSRTRSRGQMTARLERPGVGGCELTGWASIPSRDIHALTISVRTFLQLAGRESVTVVGERTSGGARFRATWKV